MSSLRKCTQCAGRFEGEKWQRLCWACWREHKDAEERRSEYKRGWNDGHAAAIRRQPQIEDDVLRDVISLCHPDRHPVERFVLANATTARLLELRAELAA